MKGLKEIVLAGTLTVIGCDTRKDITVKEGMIGEQKLRIIYECRPVQINRLRFEIYDSNNALRFRETILHNNSQGGFALYNGESGLIIFDDYSSGDYDFCNLP